MSEKSLEMRHFQALTYPEEAGGPLPGPPGSENGNLGLDPPDRALVLCVDEKSQVQALDRTAPILPSSPGLPERQTHDYKRYGTTTLFAAFNILNGKVIGSCLPRHRGREFVRFLRQLEKEAPPDLDVHLILDNHSTHKGEMAVRLLAERNNSCGFA